MNPQDKASGTPRASLRKAGPGGNAGRVGDAVIAGDAGRTDSAGAARYARLWQEAEERPAGLAQHLRRTVRRSALSAAAAAAELRYRLTGRINTATVTNDAHGAAAGSAPSLRLLFCHYVFDNQIQAFETLLRALQREGDFIDTRQALNMLRGDTPIERNCFHLSFDDGFANVARNAAPVMKRLGVPGAFFVPSAMIGADYDTVRNYCLNVTRYNAVIELATWDELKRLVDQGFEIGSHTRTHTRFADMSGSRDKMVDEIFGSKADIERELGVPCPTISWPYGRLSDADDRSLALVREAGYEACFGAFRGHVQPSVTDAFSIPRHHFEPQWPLAHVRYFARGAREVLPA